MTKIKKRLIFILSALCLISAFCFSACSDGGEAQINPIEKQYGYVYSSQYEGACDPDIKIDGNLDEAIWQNKKWYTSKYCADIYGTMPELNVTAFNTKYGAYIGVKVRDNNILYNGMLNPSKNSTLEFYFYAEKTDTVLEDLDRSVRRAFMMDYAGELYSTGERFKRAFNISGEINSGNTVGATVELFIPWSEMGIDVSDGTYPQIFRLLPTYRPILKGNSAHTPLFNKPFNPMHHISDYYVFDEDGYTDADKEGAIVGDAYNGTAKSGSWDLEELDKGVISVTEAGEYNSIFFRDAFCENFVAETTIYPLGGTKRRNGWYSGFFLLTTTGDYYTMMLDMRSERHATAKDGGKTLNKYSLTTLTEAHAKWEQINKIIKINPLVENGAERSGVRFKIIKDQDSIYYFVDGEYLYSESIDFVQGDVYAGIFNMNAYARFEDFSFKALSSEEVVERLYESDVFDVNVSYTGGGEVVSDKKYTAKGESVNLKLLGGSGYKFSFARLNGEDITEDVKEKAVGGIYRIENVTDDISVEISFEEISAPLTLSGSLVDEYGALEGEIYLLSNSSGAYRYDLESSTDKGFEIKVDSDEYSVFVDNYLGSTILNVNEDKQIEIDLCDYVRVQTGNSQINYLDIDYIGQSANSVKGRSTEWFLVGEGARSAYLAANVYSYDLDGFTVETFEGDNVQFYFAYQGVYVFKDHGWNYIEISDKETDGETFVKSEELYKKYSYFNEENKGSVLSALSVERLDGELVEIAISDGVLYVSVEKTGKIRLDLSEFNENFTEDTEYILGFCTYDANNSNYPASGAMYKNMSVCYGDNAADRINEVKAACENDNDYVLGRELYDGSFVTKVGDAINYSAKKAGARIIDGFEIEQNEPFMIYADIESSKFNGVGFVVGTLGGDDSDHVLFNWRPARDIYVTREGNGEKWGWRGVNDNKYPCSAAMERQTKRLTLVYRNGLYLFYVDGVLYANVSEEEEISKVILKNYVGTTGTKKLGLSVLYGSVLISDFGYSKDLKEIDEFLEYIPLYKASTIKETDNRIEISSPKNASAFVLSDVKIAQGVDFIASVRIEEVSAKHVGFVVGTLSDGGKNHVLFDWRNSGDKKDIYVWRNDPYGWVGFEDGKYPCSEDIRPSTLTLVYKSGIYYMFIDGVNVLSLNSYAKFAWSNVVVNDAIGTEGEIMVGLSTSGTAVFSDFSVSFDAEKINEFVPDPDAND